MANHSFTPTTGDVNTVLFTEVVPSPEEYRYLQDQRELLAIAQRSPGFVNADFVCPIPGLRVGWLTIIQFEQENHLQDYLSSRELEELSLKKDYLLSSKRQFLSNFTQKASMLITTTIKPENEQKWLDWNQKINQVMRTFPGFLESDIQPSKIEQKNNNKTWIVNFQFDSFDNLNNWLNSPQRKTLIDEGDNLYEASVVSEFPSGFSSWFDVKAKTSAVASWKMPWIVEMGLYPVVLIQTKFFGFLNIFPLPVVLLINTLISCLVLQYFVIPIIQKIMRFWLYPQTGNREKIDLLGIAMAVSYLLIVCQVMLFVLEP